MSAQLDLAYGAEHPKQALDLYLPDAAEACVGAPLVVFCHGGAWLSGDRRDVAHVGRFLADNGYPTACVSYRLAPDYRFPAQADDVVSALGWLRDQRDALALGDRPWVLAGHSAGAHLALLLSLDPRWLPADIVPVGVMGLCGVYDLMAASSNRWMRTTMLVPALGDDPALWREASPLNHARSHPARFWLHNAQVDWGLHRHTAALAAALTAQGNHVETSVAEGRHHLDIVAHLGEPDDDTSRRLLAWLSALTRDVSQAFNAVLGARTMADWSRQLASSSAAEVVVCGTGVAALSAALAARAAGRAVLLCGPGPALADEVTVALAGDLLGTPTDEHLAALVAEVESVGGLHDEWLDGPLTEMAADRLLAAAGIELLLYVQPVAIVGDGPVARGVLLAGKHGLELISAGAVVDATADGALFAASGVDFVAPESVSVSRSIYLQYCGDDLSAVPAEVNGMAVSVRPTWPGEVRLTVTTDAPWDGLPVPDEAAVTTRAAVEAVSRVARTACPALAESAVSHTGHRPLPLNGRQMLPAGPSHPTWQNAFGAGAWVQGDRPGDLDRLARSGSAAGRLAAESAGRPVTCGTAVELNALSEPADVVVAGGGTGGAVAALAAARQGAATLLYEAGHFCGGIGTGGGIHVYYHGVRGGLQDGIDEATERIGEALGGRSRFVGFSPEAKKIAFECALAEAGVEVRYEWTVADVVRREGRVVGIVAARPGLLEYRPCACVVDGTGDGDVAALAGAPMTHGRASDGVAHAYSQSCGKLQGERVSFTNFDAGYVDATDPDDLTRARRFGIQVYWPAEPPTPTDRLLYLAPLLGLRQSRHAVTDYVVSLVDQTRGASFADDIAYGRCHYDNHAFDYENESDEARFWCWTLGRWRDHMQHGVPYRSLLPLGVDGLVMGSRALGVSHDAHMLFRMQRDMQRIGEAAGTAAALAARAGTTPRALGAEPVRRELAATGALLSDWASEVAVAPSAELIAALPGDGARTAAWQLYLLGEPAVEALQSALGADSPQARWYAAATLAMLGHADGASELRRALAEHDEARPMNTNDTHHAERSAPRWKSAIGLLGQIGDAEAVPLLADLLADPRDDGDALISAVRALGAIGTSAALAALEAFADQLDAGASVPEAYLQLSMGGGRRLPRDIAWFVRSALVEALAELGCDRRHLIDAYLDDERAWVRVRAQHLASAEPATRLTGSGEATRVKARR